MDKIEVKPICEWHLIDEIGNEVWVWASTESDARQQARAVPGWVGNVGYCNRVKDESEIK